MSRARRLRIARAVGIVSVATLGAAILVNIGVDAGGFAAGALGTLVVILAVTELWAHVQKWRP